ncbi:hypothetical protein [Vibrio sp. 10N]|uniref:hypothetical protein n=1 Tax=Vibrio sp. 10N TaxID=3058938 RepID=UPI002812F7E4|nr:hypothetical protein VB10N_46420 [Vibrio sp. 10N]
MEKLSTYEIAEHMLESGKAYSITTLYKELGLDKVYVAGKFHNIYVSKKYKVNVIEEKPRTIRVIDIENKCKRQNLWSSVLQGDL